MALTSSGQPLDAATRAAMEPRFGHSFADVRVHTGEHAAQSAETVNALAYTAGSDITFNTGQYAPGTPMGDHLLAHELTHVVQQRGTAGAVQPQARDLSRPGDASEREADVVADTVMRGDVAAPISAAPTGAVQRALKTLGGDWDTDTYTIKKTGATETGLNIDLKFVPQNPVDASMIGMIQTHKAEDVGEPLIINDDATLRQHAVPEAEAGAGTHVDRLSDYGNPLYATDKPAVTDALATTATVAGWGQHGWHNKDATGAQLHQDAHLIDEPNMPARGKNASQVFETTALAVDGNQKDTYYGSVQWGWRTDSSGAFTKLPLSIVSVGAPTPTFMRAAELWNAGTTSTGSATIDLPTASSFPGGVMPATMTTGQLAIRIEQLRSELASLPPGGGGERANRDFEKQAMETELASRGDQPTTTLAAEQAKALALPTPELLGRLEAVEGELLAGVVAGVGRTLAASLGAPALPDPAQTNRELEKHALEKELEKREARVAVTVNSTEDWTGADEVYIKASGPGGKHFKTIVQSLNDGQSFTFAVPLRDLLPLRASDTLKLEVYDEDSPDADDLIATIDWRAPFAEAHNASSLDGASYNVTARFER